MVIKAGPATQQIDAVFVAREKLRAALDKSFVGVHWSSRRETEVNQILHAIDALIVARLDEGNKS